MIVPNSTYNASGSAMFVSPGSDWRPGAALMAQARRMGHFLGDVPVPAPPDALRRR